MNNKNIYILFIILYSCINQNNRDINFLKVYFNEYKVENNVDSIVLGFNNSNEEIFNTYKRYLRLKKDSQELGYPLNEVFLKKEYDNFKNQVVSSGKWSVDLDNFENVYHESSKINKDEILYVTKPIYTIDEKYALVYSYRQGSEAIYFIPSIEIFKKEKSVWRKISKIKHIGLN